MNVRRGKNERSAAFVNSIPYWATAREHWYNALDETSPRAYCEWNRRFPERHVVDTSTDLLIEGYPSAANSLARETFALSHPGIKIASHLHARSHVERARQLQVPILVLIREPVGSVASIMARFPNHHFDPDKELKRYKRFYSAIGEMAGDVVLFRFEDTTSRLGLAAALLNDRFGSSFEIDDKDHKLKEDVRLVLDAWSRAVFSLRAEEATPRPSAARQSGITRAKAKLVSPTHSAQLADCAALYESLATTATTIAQARGQNTSNPILSAKVLG